MFSCCKLNFKPLQMFVFTSECTNICNVLCSNNSINVFSKVEKSAKTEKCLRFCFSYTCNCGTNIYKCGIQKFPGHTFCELPNFNKRETSCAFSVEETGNTTVQATGNFLAPASQNSFRLPQVTRNCLDCFTHDFTLCIQM